MTPYQSKHCPDVHVLAPSILTHVKTHAHPTLRVHTRARAGINRKLVVVSAVGCLVTDGSNNSFPPARVGSLSVRNQNLSTQQLQQLFVYSWGKGSRDEAQDTA